MFQANSLPDETTREWLEPDGLGGFASNTRSFVPTRRYHALLLAALTPPTQRFVLVNGFRAWLETPTGNLQLTQHYFAPGVLTEADAHVEQFTCDPWPTVRYVTRTGLVVIQETFVRHGSAAVFLSFRLESHAPNIQLYLRPFLSGRDFHSLQRKNSAFDFQPEVVGAWLRFSPYAGVPSIALSSNGTYTHAPEWYLNFRYREEQARGLDCEEDLATPGVIQFDLSAEPALLICAASTPGEPLEPDQSAPLTFARYRLSEVARRSAFPSPLARAADAYLVSRGVGRTIIAGYPWFGDWGRDTFIALRGLCLATGRLSEARAILVEWSAVVSEGMLPNRFPDGSGPPEYNSVDASLWYVIAASELLRHPLASTVLSAIDHDALSAASCAIVEGYAGGTRFGIRLDEDGLLACGEPGTQLTWMDAKVGDYVVTPRIGKPVEIQALWLNALAAVAGASRPSSAWLERGVAAFEARFWNEAKGCLYDVVDVNHQPGLLDAALRPNQVFALGALPVRLVSPLRAARALLTVEHQLLTPLGLRTLSPDDPAYVARYEGGVWERDTSYHQGTAWPWLMGAFVEAWLNSRGNTAGAKREAEARFLAPLLARLGVSGIGHLPEIADGEPPHRPRGCPFQAWSVSELLRLQRLIGR